MNVKELIFGGGVKAAGGGGAYRDSIQAWLPIKNIRGGVVVTRETYPQYRGALVVCEGGGNDAVRLQVVSAVSALTGLGADKISICQGG